MHTTMHIGHTTVMTHKTKCSYRWKSVNFLKDLFKVIYRHLSYFHNPLTQVHCYLCSYSLSKYSLSSSRFYDPVLGTGDAVVT